MNWAQLVPLIAELVLLIVKNWFQKDADKRAENVLLQNQAAQAIKTRDASAITSSFDKLRS